MIYFDTAYILKCYINEKGSDEVRLFATEHVHIACCRYGRAEVLAAFHRNLREGFIDQEYMDIVIDQFRRDNHDHVWNWLPVTNILIEQVVDSFRTLPADVFLRTGDALHLCCARQYGLTEIYSNDSHVLKAANHFDLIGKNILNNSHS